MDKKACTWGTLCHLTALCGLIGIPFGHLLGPLVVWLIKRNDYPFVDEQGKESLNFQISMTLYALVAALLILVAVGIPILIAIAVLDAVFVIIASLKANRGEHYRYPLTIRLIN